MIGSQSISLCAAGRSFPVRRRKFRLTENSLPEFRRCATRWRDIRWSMKVSNYRVIPLKTEVAEAARRTAKSGASDHRVVAVDSPRGYPCRHCLRWAKPGEQMILFPFAAIPPGHPYSETGPIFVHEQSCER